MPKDYLCGSVNRYDTATLLTKNLLTYEDIADVDPEILAFFSKKRNTIDINLFPDNLENSEITTERMQNASNQKPITSQSSD